MSKGQKKMADGAGEIKSDLVRQLADILDDTGLSEIEYDTGTLRIRVARQAKDVAVAVPATAAPQPTPAPAAQAADTAKDSQLDDPASHPGAVKAPMVGVAYLAAEPDTPPYVKVGDKVTEGQTLMLIEAMKTFNPVRAPRTGTVAAVLVTDGQPIEFDQPLVVIE